MELKAGYKRTEVGVIPDDWEVKKLKEVVTKFVNGGTPSTQIENYWKGDIPWISGADILNQKVDAVRRYITNDAVKNSSTNVIKKGNLLFVSRTGVGKLAIAPFDIAISQDFTGIYLKDILKTEFLFKYFDFISPKLQVQNQGTSIQGITRDTLASLPVPIPSFTEQNSIATALSDADALISSLEKLIEKKRAIKQGAMQQLLKPKEGWVVKKLGEVLGRVTTGKLDANAMKENGEYRFYTCAKDYYFIDEYAFDTEALLVSGNGANVGYIHYYKGKFNAYQRTYVLTDFSIDVFYIKLYLDSYLKDRITTEVSAGNTPYIKIDTITDMIIYFPSNFEEQTRIATILSDMDAEISALETKLEKYRKVKLGMMQNLLTGKIRLV